RLLFGVKGSPYHTEKFTETTPSAEALPPAPPAKSPRPPTHAPRGGRGSRSRDRGRDQRVRSRQSRPGHPRHPGRDVSVPRGTDPREIGTFNWQTYDVWEHLDER